MSSEDMNIDPLNELDQQKEEFPQYLCKNCAKCCKSITTSYTYEELKQMSEEGEEEAKVFIEFFKAFPSIEEARKVVPEQVDQVMENMRKTGSDLSKVTFYYCPHVTENNLCSIYEKRPGCCRRAPRNGWSIMPPGCGFEGWQFEQRERQKRLIRSLKEYLYMLESLSKDGMVPGKNMTVEELKKSIEEKIKPWERYGAENW